MVGIRAGVGKDVFCVSLVVLLAAGPCGLGGLLGTEELKLVEERAIVLPSALVITQGSLSDHGHILLWGPENSWIVQEGEAVPLCGYPVPHVLNARIGVVGEVEAILGPPNQGLLISSQEGCQFKELGNALVELEAAASVGNGWIALGAGGGLIEVTLTGQTRSMPASSRSVATLAEAASDNLPSWMAPAGGGIILGQRGPPFTWLFSSLEAGEILATPFDREAALAVQEMVSTGVVSASPGFLQVVADLRSERRTLITFDQDGKRIRATEVAVPLGVLASNERTKRILAVRRTDLLEVVVYNYSWKPTRGRE